jgi:hypothetical protein
VNFYYGGDTFSLSNPEDAAIVLELDTAGNIMCGSMESSGGDDESGIVSDPSGRFIYWGGDLESFAPFYIFGKDTLISNTGSGEYPFVARWLPCGDTITGISQLESLTGNVSLSPNPNNGIFTIQSSVNSRRLSVEIYNMMGQKVYSAPTLLPHNVGGASSAFQINISTQPNGVYLYRVMDENGALIGSGKFVVEK